MLDNILLIIGAYLFGSLPVLYWIGRFRGVDLRNQSDMHISLWREVGFAEGLAGILWDIFKGPVPPLAAWGLNMGHPTIGLCGLAVTAGQMWPVFLGFRHGEKGNTTGIGASFAMAPWAMACAAVPVAIGAAMRGMSGVRRRRGGDREGFKFAGTSDSMPLGMFVGFSILPIMAWVLPFHYDITLVWCFVALFSMIMFRRLTADLAPELQGRLKTSLASVLWNRLLYDRSYY